MRGVMTNTAPCNCLHNSTFAPLTTTVGTVHGAMPDAQDLTQDLFIVDHDDAFFLRGFPISDIGGYHGSRARDPEARGTVFEAP